MVDFVYTSGVGGFFRGDIDWENDDIEAVLIDDDIYEPDEDSHSTLIDIPAEARLASTKLTGRYVAGRWLKADAAGFSQVSGSNAGAVAIVKMVADQSLPVLVAYADNISGFPVKPNGSNIRVGWADEGIVSIRPRQTT